MKAKSLMGLLALPLLQVSTGAMAKTLRQQLRWWLKKATSRG